MASATLLLLAAARALRPRVWLRGGREEQEKRCVQENEWNTRIEALGFFLVQISTRN